MFALTPGGKNGSESSNSDKIRTSLRFFTKLSLYFVAIRAAHICFGPKSTVGNSTSA